MKRLGRKNIQAAAALLGLAVAALAVLVLLLHDPSTQPSQGDDSEELASTPLGAPHTDLVDLDQPLDSGAFEEAAAIGSAVAPELKDPLAGADAAVHAAQKALELDPTQGKKKAKQAAPGRVVGIVKDPEGQGVAEAKVVVFGWRRGGRKRLQTTTDATGRFALEVPPGRYSLWAEGKGFAPSERDWRMQVKSNEDTERELVLRVGGILRGQVLTADSRPIEGVTVRAQQRNRERQETQTDAEGNFAIPDLAEGLYTVTAEAKGFVRSTQRDVPVTPAQGGKVDLLLQVGGQLTGLVKSSDNKLLEKAWVFVYQEGRRLGAARSDAEGRYTLEGLFPGPVELFARSNDYALTARLEATVKAGQLVVADVPLNESARITGILTGADGKPRANLHVTASSIKGDVRRRAKSDAAGRYVIKSLYPGTYELAVRSTQRSWGSPARIKVQVEVTYGEVQRDLAVPTGALLAGVVRGTDGQPVKNAPVFAIVGQDYRGTARSNAEGKFRIEGLPADTYNIFVRVGNDKLVALQQVELREETRIEDYEVVVRPPARLRGIVRDGAGQPIEGLQIQVRSLESPVRRRARTNAEGRFEIAPLYDGGYRIKVDEGSLRLLAAKREAQAAQVEPVTFQVEQGRNVERELRVELVAQ